MATAYASAGQIRRRMRSSSTPNSSSSGLYLPSSRPETVPRFKQIEENPSGAALGIGGEEIDLWMMIPDEDSSAEQAIQQYSELGKSWQAVPSKILLFQAKMDRGSNRSQTSLIRLLEWSFDLALPARPGSAPFHWSRSSLYFLIAKLWEESSNSSVDAEGAGGHEPRSETALRILFPLLVSETPRGRNRIREFILRISDPRSLCRIAFQEYDRTYKSELLLHLRSLLEDSGPSAWPALKEIAKSEREECELFAGPIARFSEVPETERLDALRALSLNPSRFVRSKVLEHIGSLCGETTTSILELLRQDPDPDIREEAGEYLRAPE